MKDKLKSVLPIDLAKLLKAKCFGAKFPHAVQFNITFRCNQRCIYCGIYNEKRPEMTTEQIYNMLDEFADLGTAKLSITGGEPLLRDDFQAVVQHAKKRRLSVSLSTNGSLVAERIHQLDGLDSIDMTLDGPEPIHDQQRGKGNFKKVLEAIRLIQVKKIPLYLVSVITKNNCTFIEEMLALAKSLKVELLIQPVFYSEQSHANNTQGYASTKCEDKVMLQALDRLIELKKQGNPVIILSRRYYQKIKEAIMRGSKIRCSNAGSLFCTISPDGKVAPCNLLVKDSRWLNGNEVGFKKAFLAMSGYKCEGCLTSFIDIDDLYSFKPDVVWNYYKYYRKFFATPQSERPENTCS